MSFKKFRNIEAVKQAFPHILLLQGNLIPTDLAPYPVTAHFRETIEFNLTIPRSNEYANSEFLIVPILLEVWKARSKHLKFWSHPTLKVDDVLTGNPDYLFSYSNTGEYLLLVGPPIVSVVEAKYERFQQGWAQCLAEMIACQQINDDKNIALMGIVTTGSEWQFGKLQGNEFLQNPLSYGLSDMPKLLGAIDFLLAEAESQFESK